MEWSRVGISWEDDTESDFKSSLASQAGLDTDAYASHHKFINDIPHLEDVMKMHGKSIESGILPSGGSNFNSAIKSFDDAISNLGAIPLESGLEIPINSNLIENIVLETTSTAPASPKPLACAPPQRDAWLRGDGVRLLRAGPASLPHAARSSFS